MAEEKLFDPEFFTQEVGPLPMWAWAGAVGGALGFYLYYRRTSNPATVDAAESVAVGAASDTGYGTTRPGIGGYATSSGMEVPTVSTPQTNHDWSVKAQNILVAQGFDPGTVATALSNYLAGNTLSAQHAAIVSEALRAAGPTPEPVAPAVIPETPVNAPSEQGFFGVGYGPLTKEFWAAHSQDDAILGLNNERYSWLPSAAAVKAAQSTGQQTFYQPAPGIFAPTTGFTAAQWQNTPIFVKA